MADRIVTWTSDTLYARHYMEKDYEPVALRIYADVAPKGRALVVDILQDDVSIMSSNDFLTHGFETIPASIEYITLAVSTFKVGEAILGTTSSSTAIITKSEVGHLELAQVSAAFTVTETITGQTDSATGVVAAYVAEVRNHNVATGSNNSRAVLRRDNNSDDVAGDFLQNVEIEDGSWLSLSVLDLAGASGITVQLELDSM